MSTIYLIRHGQAGPRQRYDELSDLGRAQARLAGEYFACQRIELRAAICGALDRQRQTAEEALRAMPGPPELSVDPDWSEFDLAAVYEEFAPRLSEADPQFRQEHEETLRLAAAEDSAIHRTWTRCDALVVRAWIEGRWPCRTESWGEFCARARRALDKLAGYGKADTIAVFTSATPIGVAAGTVLGIDGWSVLRLAGVLYNSAITTLRSRESEFTLFNFNTVPHLADPAIRTFR